MNPQLEQPVDRSSLPAQRAPHALRRHLGLVIGLALLTLVAYGGVLGNGFVQFDDPRYVTENPNVLNGLTWKGWNYAWTTFDTGNWLPLTWLSLQLDATLYASNPAGFHATNLVIHLVNGCLLYIVLSRTTGRMTRSAIVAAFFLTHPLHVESVAWVSERKDVLSTFWLMLILLAYTQYAKRPGIFWYLTACVTYCAGLLSKSMLVTTPILLLLFDIWPLDRFRVPLDSADQPRSRWAIGLPRVVEKLPLLALSLIDGLVTIRAQGAAHAIADTQQLPFAVRAANAICSYGWYLATTFYPTRLIPFYQPSPGGTDWPSVAGWTIVLSGISLAVGWGAHSRVRLFGWWWFIISLLPVIGLIQVGSQAHADRYTYLPHIGLMTWLVWEIADRLSKPLIVRRIVLGLTVISLLVLTGLTRHQVTYWKSNTTLWEHTLTVDPENPMAHLHLGNQDKQAGQMKSARQHFERALTRWPDSFQIHNSLASLAAAEGDLESAEKHSRQALQANPGSEVAIANLAIILDHQQRWPEAELQLKQYLKIESDDQRARLLLGTMSLKLSKPQQAWEQFEIVLHASPNHPEALNQGAFALGNLNRPRDAQALFERLLRQQPDNVVALMNSGLIAEQMGDRALARTRYQSVLQHQPNHPQARQRLTTLGL
ncbi:tetratricopeptide repeat protein [Schlesneria paludicola]|uniref:tetratricopeptide repeat protein n=1 Tax=Schlesneria paludicola TaxID=360056 RepID=UPI000316ABEC|nr:tetratricopeptide repeat protein [Schlesneria paludicola]